MVPIVRRRGPARPRRPKTLSSNARGATPSNGRPGNVSRVYEELRRLIMIGQLPPGARIAERVVAGRLGISRTPVRSALHRLLQEGFITSSGGRGDNRLIISPLTLDDGHEVFFIVGHLEGLAARLAAGLPAAQRKTMVARMRAVNRELAAAVRKQVGPARIFDLDLEFHSAYIDGVSGPRLLVLHRAIKPQLERYARLYVGFWHERLPRSVREHEAIVRALAKGDPAAAQAAVEQNWHNAAERLMHVIAEHGERGAWLTWSSADAGNGARHSAGR